MFDLFISLTQFANLITPDPFISFLYSVVVNLCHIELLNFDQYYPKHTAERYNQETYSCNYIIQYISVSDIYKLSRGYTVSRHTFTFYITVTFTELKIY